MASAADPFLMPMQRLADPFGESRDDYDIFCALSERLGCFETFSENRTSREWLRHLYQKTESALKRRELPAPDFDSLMEGGPLALPVSDTPSMMEAFLVDPDKKPLNTETGRILFYSNAVASSGLPGHPAWIEPEEWLGGALAQTHPFQLLANQPFGKLHSQLDFGATSMAGKIDGREVARSTKLTLRVWASRRAT